MESGSNKPIEQGWSITSGDYLPITVWEPQHFENLKIQMADHSISYRYVPKGTEGRVTVQALEIIKEALKLMEPNILEDPSTEEDIEKTLIQAVMDAKQRNITKEMVPELTMHKPPVMYALRDVIDTLNRISEGDLVAGKELPFRAELHVDEETRLRAKNALRLLHYRETATEIV
jgi:hypothetical protein